MSPMFPTQTMDPRNGWKLSVAGARRAAERARNAASVAGAWAGRAGVGTTEAAVAADAADKAQRAAERAAKATSFGEMSNAAAAAWSAMEVALDADQRTSVLITEAMWAELDRRVTGEDQQAA